MTVKREVNLASQAALIPLFGGIDKRPRPLDKDVVAIGRARGCDIILEAPEISTLHCLVYRTSGGFRARDCGSRTGTRVNGGPLRQSFLADEDVLQIGPFSFTVKIPPAAQAEGGRPGDTVPHDKALELARLEHCQRSRKKLAILALKLRRRLAQGGTCQARHAELNGKAAELHKQIRHYDERLGELESAERDLEGDRERLRREREEHLAHVAKVETDLARRLEAVEQEVRAKWLEFGQRCAREEALLAQRAKEALYQRQNLDEAMKDKEQWAAEQVEAKGVLEKQQSAIAEAEGAIREQRSELARMMKDLRELQNDIKKEQGQDVKALTQENEDLRRLLDEAERRLVEARVAEASARETSETADAGEELKKENDFLRQLLQEQEKTRPSELGLPEHTETKDVESYEAELNRYRQQLESDRAKLNHEIEQLRVRNEELDLATREMEMEMSKERAELARERVRLDRLREEIRSEVERVQRDAGIRETLAPVHKLREELTQKKSLA